MKKTLITLTLAGLALAGCGSPIADSDPAEVPDQHVLTETNSQSLAEILAPPTPQTTLPPIGGLLPPTSPWQPASAPWQVELPEVTDLPPLPAEK